MITLIMFRTEINLKPSKKYSINYSDQIFSIGSCFSEHIYKKLDLFKFKIFQSPYKTVYNPFSILKQLEYSISGNKIESEYVCKHGTLFYHYDFHGVFSSESKADLISAIETKSIEVKKYLESSTFIMITLGTSFVYRLKENSRIVSNCHKMPKSNFLRDLLSIEEIITSLNKIIALLYSFNKNMKILFTISPERHLADGFHENQLSKSRLFLALEEIQTKNKSIEYFPAFEILLDDLRDYRFYDLNLKSPNELAVNYIFDKFKNFLCSNDSQLLMKKVEKVNKMLSHKIIQNDSAELKSFNKKLLNDLDELLASGLSFHNEYQVISKRMHA